jgi:hypothetical protein
LAYPFDDPSVITTQDNAGPTGTDEVTIKSVGLGFELIRAKWGYVLAFIPAGALSIAVRRWDDPNIDFAGGEQILIINQDRKPRLIGLQVTTADSFTFVLPNGEPVPAMRLNLAAPIPSDIGDALAVFVWDAPKYTQGVTFRINNNTLERGNQIDGYEPLLGNVEELQFAYGIDDDHDGIIETWHDRFEGLPPNIGFGKKWALKFTMVVTSEGMPGYKYPYTSYTTENHTINLTTPQQLNRRRVFLSNVLYPPNLQPGG